MKRLLASALMAAMGLAHAQMSPVGLWKQVDDETRQERALVRIVEAGGVLTGTIEKIIDPARAGSLCTLCPDDLRVRPMLGLPIIKRMTQNATDPNLWDGGEILDPNNGKTYKARLVPQDGGKVLAVRGYIGTPLLGRTQTWVRIE